MAIYAKHLAFQLFFFFITLVELIILYEKAKNPDPSLIGVFLLIYATYATFFVVWRRRNKL